MNDGKNKRTNKKNGTGIQYLVFNASVTLSFLFDTVLIFFEANNLTEVFDSKRFE